MQKITMSGLRYYNQSIPKYINGEPFEHQEAKQRIRQVLEKHGYDVQTDPEQIITVKQHKGVEGVQFPVDVYAVNRTLPDTDRIIVQIDGEYHRASEIQKGRTQNRDDTLGDYCVKHNTRYVVFNHVHCEPDIINEYTDRQIAEKVGLAE